MTPKVGDTVKCNCGCDGSPFVVATIEGDRAESADGMRSAYVSKCDVVTRPPKAKMKPAPLPRAVRELLRDVVLWHRTEDDINPGSEDMAQRAERILGVPWERIVAKARKAGRR